tara:strand:+ start:5571 stop:6083 length:513 start_codon:yes stop_codon:yes gene_type:complete
MQKRLFTITLLFLTVISAQENKLFWDGHDWNKIAKDVANHRESIIRIKSAYLNGVLDGRLYGYLKTWAKDQYLADDVFGESVDYLTPRELIRNLDNFYKDPLNWYIPVPAAIVIANMYAERVPVPVIDNHIVKTRRWINDLTLDLDTLNYSRLIEEKLMKHHQQQFNQSE